MAVKKTNKKPFKTQEKAAKKGLKGLEGKKEKLSQKIILKHMKKGETIKKITPITRNGKKAIRVNKIKKTRLLGLFPIDMDIESIIDEETGESMEEKNPWWVFLTRD